MQLIRFFLLRSNQHLSCGCAAPSSARDISKPTGPGAGTSTSSTAGSGSSSGESANQLSGDIVCKNSLSEGTLLVGGILPGGPEYSRTLRSRQPLRLHDASRDDDAIRNFFIYRPGQPGRRSGPGRSCETGHGVLQAARAELCRQNELLLCGRKERQGLVIVT